MHKAKPPRFRGAKQFEGSEPSSIVKISLVQAAFEGSGEENLEKAVSLVEEAQGDLVVLPELWNVPSIEYVEGEGVGEGFRDPFLKLSEGRTVLAGSVAERRGEVVYNKSYLFHDGEVAASYSKLHLFFGGREDEVFEAGNSVVTSDLGGLEAGLSICYDLRFPELYREQLERGAALLLVPSAWPLRRLEHWDLLTRTRAVENQCFVAACNRLGFVGDLEMAGHSRLVGPWGAIRAGGSEEECILEATIDPEEVERVREKFPSLGDRRQL